MFIPYADLPDVSAAWEAYGKRCKANLATRMMGDISEESCRAAAQQWDMAHAESWAQYLADWQAAFAARKQLDKPKGTQQWQRASESSIRTRCEPESR